MFRLIATLSAVALLSACATRPAPDFRGRWKPVNRFSESTMEIPLYSSYVYQAVPMDGTLKTMLERWAKDSNMELTYSIQSDYTLYAPVAKINTTSIQQAVAELSVVYAQEGVTVSAAGNRILVQPASSLSGGASAPAGNGSTK
ncbi:toxin co-regulated pilus biosynthesis Q family protein [Xanthomonas campestris pv. phormiicola]|nr:toxin co-regulated pilus biosynthesis Q family protein [Xanthomonas campestris pv. phormiicola]UYC18093.1 toxin co-regulated pilus biosynthesis Q family protein [Xanthomonas campestris pv. phormiicola]